MPDTGETPVRVEFSLEAEALKTRAIDENSITDVNVYFFSKGNGVDYHFYRADYAQTLTFEVLPGNYTLYVIANVDKDLGEMSQSELSLYEFSKGSMKDNIPMTANTEVNILAATTLPTLSVKRVAAKIAYSVTVDDTVAENIKLRSIQFMSVPNTAVLFSERSTSTDENDFYDEVTIVTNNVKTYSDTYYMFENCQGDVSGITDQKDKFPENAPACATYMRILADHVGGGSGKMLEYIVYLGENTTSNFDVRRNTKHTMNLVIRGENEIDNRVTVYEGLYYGKANCYICEGNQVTFDVTAYRTSKSANYAYTGIKAGEDYNPVAARILYSSITWDRITLSLVNNQLTVTANWPEFDSTHQGQNIVVAVVDGNDDILWSFHIWYPRTTITDDEYTNANDEKFLVMDRNLGEITDGTEESARTTGHCVYEWGRKDPFWYDGTGFYINATASTTKYWKNIIVADKETVVTIEDLHKNPTTFYGNGYSPEENYWGDPNNTMETYGWTSAKSVYDPCPEGYRVPNAKTWSAFDNKGIGDFWFGVSFKRNKDDTVGTFYPQGYTTEWGYQGQTFGTGVGKIGRYWASSPQYMWFSGSDWISFTTYEKDISASSVKNKGNKVRCARVQ